MAAGRPTSVTVEIEFTAGAWTDVSAYVAAERGISVQKGRTSPNDQPQVGTCRVTLVNDDGRFSPARQVLVDGTTVHPYYPNVRPRRRIRISYVQSATTYVYFVGWVTNWPPVSEWSGGKTVTVTAVDRWRQLDQVAVLPAAVQTMLTDGPFALWTMSEPSEARQTVDLVQGIIATPFGFGLDAQDATFGSSDVVLPAADGLTSLRTLNAQPDGEISGSQLPSAALANGWSVSYWMGEPVFVGGGYHGFGDWTYGYTPGFPVVSFSMQDDKDGGTAGTSVASYADGTNSLSVPFTATGNDGLMHHYASTMVDNGTTVVFNFYLDGVLQGTQSGTSTHGFASVTTLFPWALTTTAEIRYGPKAFYSRALTAAEVAMHANLGLGAKQLSGVLAAEYLEWAGLTSADWNLDTGQAFVRLLPTSNKTVASILQDLAATEGGGSAVYIANDGKVRFVDRSFRTGTTVALTAGAESDIDGGQWQPSYSDESLVNQVSVTYPSESVLANVTTVVSSAASITEFGVARTSMTLYSGYESDAVANAEDLIARVGQPGFRLTQLSIDLMTATTDFYAALGAIQIGSRVRVTGLAANLAPLGSLDVIVEGWSATIDVNQFRVVFDTSPADSPRRAVWDTDRWQPDDGTLTLTSTITSSGTSVSLTTAATHPTLTTVGGNYPMVIQIGEEQMTITSAPGSGTSPQTVTVTRASNSTIGAAQTAGAVVKLAPVTTWAL